MALRLASCVGSRVWSDAHDELGVNTKLVASQHRRIAA
jgi:hypothetical protein